MNINGIDVSHHNDINWIYLSGIWQTQNLYFIYFKATQGDKFVDSAFNKSWANVLDHGFLRGAYHFLDPNKDPVLQAQHFASVVGNLQPGDFPPVADVEWLYYKAKGPDQWDNFSAKERVQILNAFLAEAETLFGQKLVIYTHPVFWRDSILNGNTEEEYKQLSENPLWMVNLTG